MELDEFAVLAEPLLERSVVEEAEHGFALVEGRTATADEIAIVERRLGIALPEGGKESGC